jgi:hypothetical protein
MGKNNALPLLLIDMDICVWLHSLISEACSVGVPSGLCLTLIKENILPERGKRRTWVPRLVSAPEDPAH